jgi:hypothetical protein
VSKRLPIAALVAAGALAALAPAASAAAPNDTIITGAGTSAISLTASSPASAGTLTPGATTTFLDAPVALVTPNGTTWTLNVTDSAGNGGKLASLGLPTCSSSEAQTSNQLHFLSSAALSGATGGTGVLSAGSSQVATGTSLSNTIHVTWSLAVDPTEQIKTACEYATTATYTLS